MTEQDEFGVIYNNDYEAWYIVYRLKDTKEFKIDTKVKIRPDNYDNDCVTDSFIERIKEVAQNGYVFNPCMSINCINKIDWF